MKYKEILNDLISSSKQRRNTHIIASLPESLSCVENIQHNPESGSIFITIKVSCENIKIYGIDTTLYGVQSERQLSAQLEKLYEQVVMDLFKIQIKSRLDA